MYYKALELGKAYFKLHDRIDPTENIYPHTKKPFPLLMFFIRVLTIYYLRIKYYRVLKLYLFLTILIYVIM